MNEFDRPPSRVPTPFSYAPPDTDAAKAIVVLGRTDRMNCLVQIIKNGGENNLHSHPHQDGLWFVLSGRVRFYGDNDVVLGEFGRHEGIIMPRGNRYWFESVGDETLEILQADAFDIAINDLRTIIADRVNVGEVKKATVESTAMMVNARRGS